MATQSSSYAGPDDLDDLKQKRLKIAVKIDGLERQILELKERDAELAKKIFEREDGRILKAAKQAMKEHPEFKKLLDRYREDLDIAGVTAMPKKRGRPAKVASVEDAKSIPDPNSASGAKKTESVK